MVLRKEEAYRTAKIPFCITIFINEIFPKIIYNFKIKL